MPELMLLSNSFSPGRGALEHAMDALAAFFAGDPRVLFVPYAASDPDGYAEAMREILGNLGVRVTSAHRAADPLAALAGVQPSSLSALGLVPFQVNALLSTRPRYDSPAR